MPIEITMPRLSDTMQAGTIVKWNVQEGQKVKSGDVVADIETDKATMELQSFDDGTVASLPVSEGQNVPIGTVIMVLATGKEDPATIKSSQGASGGSAQARPVAAAAERAPEPAGGNAPVATLTQSTNGAHSQSGTGEGGRVFASPLAKKIAAESGMNLTGVQGTGPGGRIIRKDVEAAGQGRTTDRQALRRRRHHPCARPPRSRTRALRWPPARFLSPTCAASSRRGWLRARQPFPTTR